MLPHLEYEGVYQAPYEVYAVLGLAGQANDPSWRIEERAPALASAASCEAAELRLKAASLDRRAQELCYQLALDMVSDGVCFFDGEERLLFCNRRYAEIYCLSPEQVRPGATMREIAEWRAAVGTSPVDANDGLSYYAWCSVRISSARPGIWTVALKDGRTIRIQHQPMPDGGWVSTHQDIVGLPGGGAADTRMSLQTLIDWVPDNLWVKDDESRFVIANKATALRMGFDGPRDLIGKTDLELCPAELAQEYISDERRVLESGQPMIDKQEYVEGALGRRTSLLTTKVPLRSDSNEIFGLVGVSRDITERRKAEEALRASFEAIVAALANTVEMRDAYTAGHQQRVAKLAVAIARELRMPKSQIDGLYLAAIIHDVGKIDIPSDILNKPGKLSDLQLQLVRGHAQAGYDIIKGIDFPWPIAQIVWQHHERLDGSGYPQGLKDEAILPEARILMVADVVEAMMSHRPYRPALGVAAALAELERNKGGFYDPAAAEACVGLFRNKGFAFA